MILYTVKYYSDELVDEFGDSVGDVMTIFSSEELAQQWINNRIEELDKEAYSIEAYKLDPDN